MSVSERRVADRRHEPRAMPVSQTNPPADHPSPSTMRDNPEVMGRTEPQGMQQTMEPRPRSEAMMMWPDMTDLQRRFEEIQSAFIEDPKAAVQKAEHLMEEAVERVTKSMRERIQSMHRDTGDNTDTEHLRLTMRTYREFIQSLDGRRAA